MWENNREVAKSRRNQKSIITGTLYNRVKANSRTGKKDFNLTKEQFYVLATSNCFYCNEPPSLKCHPTVKKGGRKGKAVINYDRYHLYNGIDRIDNRKGYDLENVVSCCWVCNISKRTMSVKSFYAWVCRAYHHMLDKDLISSTSNGIPSFPRDS
jgi:hypothetical protein